MNKEMYWKLGGILLVLGLAAYSISPVNEKIKLGLDLQGGMHLALEVETEKAIESTMERFVSNIIANLKKDGKKVSSIQLTKTGIEIEPGTVFDEDIQKAVEEAEVLELAGDLSKKGKLVYQLTAQARKNIEERAVEQGLETIRNRIDQFGVSEPAIQREGEKRIIVQLPGINDTERAIELIGKTARLEFKIVDDEADLDAALNGNIPEGDEILYQKTVDRVSGMVDRRAFVLKKTVMMTGEFIERADVRIDTQFNEPYISLDFNREGAKLFAKITKENVKKRMAVILDGNVYTAPVIQEEISGGSAQISGAFTTAEARDIAIILRAGALPAPVHILENRTVGPSLGRDSVSKGVKSTLVGGILVLLFMAFYYKKSGFIAVTALTLNILILMGCMAYFEATLTLPGIAGIILTIGMAVDANILIFERIREELSVGKTIRASIESGFSRAFLTILDANVTTMIAAIVLFQFGTGPIKGFAVTLSIGIGASMFTSIFVSRVIFTLTTTNRKLDTLSI
ncbi:MAG: protein translocase subunit SecD [Nitrospinota bacterium]